MSSFYTNAKTLFFTAGVNLTTDDLRCVLVATSGGTAYSYNATHSHLSDVPAGTRIATSGTMTTPTVVAGVFDADDVTYPNLASAQVVGALIIYKNTGTEATSPLVAYLDYASNLPFTPDGNNLKIIWPSSGGIFSFY